MSWLFEIAMGICLIILVSGGVNAINTYVSSRAKQEKRGKGPGGEGDPLESRLAEVERRLTDVQDVMLALSEKFDRWEEHKSQMRDG
jgi:hypothetical protein